MDKVQKLNSNECNILLKSKWTCCDGVAGLLQAELVKAAMDRGSLEQELAATKLVVERVERDGRQETSKFQAEITALRQRLDRADADLMHSRRENLRLAEQVASLEREVC
jgi:serologically defined colon cancer antigen 8